MRTAISFYRDKLGFMETETVDYKGHQCLFLRNNTEHHSLSLYPLALRKELGCRDDTQLFAFAVRLANYQQLKNSISFFRENGCTIREDIPPEL